MPKIQDIYIVSGKQAFRLSATTNLKVDLPIDVPTHPLEFGQDVIDHSVNKNQVITISGMVSDIEGYYLPEGFIADVQNFTNDIANTLGFGDVFNVNANDLDYVTGTEEYLRALIKLRESKEVVLVHYDSRLHSADGLKNCVLKNLSFSKSPDLGRGYLVDLTFEQIRFSPELGRSEIDILAFPNLNGEEDSEGSQQTLEELLDGSVFLDATRGIFGG